MQLTADRLDSERLSGFADGQTDICDCRVAFATENPSDIHLGFGVLVLWYTLTPRFLEIEMEPRQLVGRRCHIPLNWNPKT